MTHTHTHIHTYTLSQMLEHILSPFMDIDELTENEKIWNFEDENISTYTYFAVCGTGSTIPLVCFIMQLIIPILLLSLAVGDRADDTTAPLTEQILSSLGSCNPGEWSIGPKDDEDGGAYNSQDGKIMAFLVVAFYFFKVVPDTAVSFYNTAGTADTTYSRIMSMRRMVWEQGDDSLGQVLGYKVRGRDVCVLEGDANCCFPPPPFCSSHLSLLNPTSSTFT